MDDFKPEDDMKADRNDRRAGRSRQSSERDADPQINFDDLDLEADEGRPTRANKARRERDEEEYEEDLESEEEVEEEQQVERRPRKRKKAPAKPASRQYVMMGVGVLVLLLLIVGVGSALKSPSSSNESASGEKSVNLSGDQSMTADQNNNAAQPVDQTAGNTNQQQPQDVSLPPIASNPTQGQPASEPQGQQRVEVQGDLNNALTQQQGQLDSAVANSTLPTEPATVAPMRNGAAPRQTTERQTAATPRPAERKQVVIEPKPQSKPQATAKAPVETKPKHVESAPATTASKPVATAQTKPAATTAPTATAPAATTSAPAATAPAATAAAGSKTAGDVGSMKSAPSGNYTLQLSSSSNYNNLNNWAKKEKLEKYVVYETTRNGQPWYVLVSGIYASKDEAKRAVANSPLL